MSKKLYIKTYGCQMNVYDSDRMVDVLGPHGYEAVDAPEGADLVILNTCHIREKAAEKLYSDLGRLRIQQSAKAEEGGRMLLAVAGCVAQAEGEEILARAPYVDMVVGPQNYHTLPELLANAEAMRQAQVKLDFVEEAKFDLLPKATHSSGASAFVSVQEGCDKFCTFCVVPYTRGTEFSRPVADVLAEVQAHAARGVIEITLLGQNVNAYHGIFSSPSGEELKEATLADLIREVAKIPQIQRIRYTTSHPRDMSDDLIAAHGEVEKLMPYLHLPVQSGSNRILKAMNRKHTAAEYLAIIDKLRAVRPDIAFSSDFIVGFPGETDQDHADTLALVEAVGFAAAYSFKYSPRPGTPAAMHEHQVPEAVKDARLQELQRLIARQSEQFNATKIGTIQTALVHKEGRREAQQIGKSPYMQSVVFESAVDYHGQLVDVKITDAYPNSIKGEVISNELRKIA